LAFKYYCTVCGFEVWNDWDVMADHVESKHGIVLDPDDEESRKKWRKWWATFIKVEEVPLIRATGGE
jgi:hypothetical protein